MADLIDRAALLERIDAKFFATDPSGEEQLGYLNSRTLVRTAPAVDAVEVVRCIKCEMHDNCYAEDVFKFARMDLEKAFCCLGKERRTDADN